MFRIRGVATARSWCSHTWRGREATFGDMLCFHEIPWAAQAALESEIVFSRLILRCLCCFFLCLFGLLSGTGRPQRQASQFCLKLMTLSPDRAAKVSEMGSAAMLAWKEGRNQEAPTHVPCHSMSSEPWTACKESKALRRVCACRRRILEPCMNHITYTVMCRHIPNRTERDR